MRLSSVATIQTTAGRLVLGSAMTAAIAATSMSVGAQTLTTAVTADPAMIDPITFSELISGDILINVYEGFTAIDADGGIVPALAVSWEGHDDNLGFTFELREGVMTHLGNEFTAHDVKYTFEQLLIPDNRGGLNAEYLAPIVGAEAMSAGETTELEGVTVVDDYTLEVRFTEPDVLFPIYPFYFMDDAVADLEAEWFLETSAGTGPFAFETWDRGQRVSLTAHEDYWGEGPHVDGVEFLIVPSGDTMVSMFEAGELDIVYAEPAAIRRILQTPELVEASLQVPAAQIRYLGMNQNLYEPFRDIRVREAICIAFDRQAMVDGLFEGAAFPLAGQVTPGVAGFNPDLEVMPYDPERAQELLAEAGYPGGEGLPPIGITSTEQNRNELLYFASQFQQVLGMPVEVDVQERGTFIQGMNAGEVPFFPWGWSAGYPDALYFLSQVWYGPSPYNRARWQNDEFDALIEEAQGTADNEARYALYNEAERILLEDFGTCPITVRMQVALVADGVEGVRLTPFRFLPFNTVTMN
ncbi:MAG: ABC transporter substrate-binding protein [Azospirillaceae bacterium]